MLSWLLRNTRTAYARPDALPAYVRWLGHRLTGREIAQRLPGGDTIRGFGSFSEYYMSSPPSDSEVALLKRYARGVVLDIGAHRGAFALTIARLAPTARITAFEPSPQTFRALRANVERSGVPNVTVESVAMSDSVGVARFTDHREASAQNHLVRPGDHDTAEVVEVPTTTLDAYAAANKLDRIDFVKIDAEGAEPLILAGAKGLFAAERIAAALIEVCPGWLAHVGSSAETLVAQVADMGYRAYSITADGSAGPPLAPADWRGQTHINALLLPAATAGGGL